MIKAWKIGLSAFIASLLVSGWFLGVLAPAEMVEVELTGLVGNESLEWIQSQYAGSKPSLWLQKDTEANRLVMTSGNDRFYQKEGPGRGRWLMESDHKNLVLGEKLVGRYFHRPDVIGSTVTFLDQEYEVVGITEGSRTIWVPYEDGLESKLDWDRSTLRLLIPNETFEAAFLSQVKQSLKRFDLGVLLVVNHKNWRWAFFNLAIAIVVIGLWNVFVAKTKDWIRAMSVYLHRYRLTHRLKSAIQYVKENRDETRRLLMDLLPLGLSAAGTVFLFRLLNLPMSLRPGNFFSLAAYGNLLEQWGEYFLRTFRHGLSDFQMLAFLMWGLSLGVGILAYWIALKRGRNDG